MAAFGQLESDFFPFSPEEGFYFSCSDFGACKPGILRILFLFSYRKIISVCLRLFILQILGKIVVPEGA